jgi:hypothetical protein
VGPLTIVQTFRLRVAGGGGRLALDDGGGARLADGERGHVGELMRDNADE